MEQVIDFITVYGPTVVQALLAIVGGASVIARLTPTEADDKVVDAVLRFLNLVAFNKPAARSK